MRLSLAVVTAAPRRVQGDVLFPAVAEYVARVRQYVACDLEFHATEAELLRLREKRSGRSAAALVLFDSRGKLMSSEAFAAEIGGFRDRGRQQLMLGIGPADGWSAEARSQADLQVSIGPMTLPHVLAMAVASEQIYRAWTILAGHPYHTGH